MAIWVSLPDAQSAGPCHIPGLWDPEVPARPPKGWDEGDLCETPVCGTSRSPSGAGCRGSLSESGLPAPRGSLSDSRGAGLGSLSPPGIAGSRSEPRLRDAGCLPQSPGRGGRCPSDPCQIPGPPVTPRGCGVREAPVTGLGPRLRGCPSAMPAVRPPRRGQAAAPDYISRQGRRGPRAGPGASLPAAPARPSAEPEPEPERPPGRRPRSPPRPPRPSPRP